MVADSVPGSGEPRNISPSPGITAPADYEAQRLSLAAVVLAKGLVGQRGWCWLKGLCWLKGFALCTAHRDESRNGGAQLTSLVLAFMPSAPTDDTIQMLAPLLAMYGKMTHIIYYADRTTSRSASP